MQLAEAVQHHKAAARRGDVRWVLVANQLRQHTMQHIVGVHSLQSVMHQKAFKQLLCYACSYISNI